MERLKEHHSPQLDFQLPMSPNSLPRPLVRHADHVEHERAELASEGSLMLDDDNGSLEAGKMLLDGNRSDGGELPSSDMEGDYVFKNLPGSSDAGTDDEDEDNRDVRQHTQQQQHEPPMPVKEMAPPSLKLSSSILDSFKLVKPTGRPSEPPSHQQAPRVLDPSFQGQHQRAPLLKPLPRVSGNPLFAPPRGRLPAIPQSAVRGMGSSPRSSPAPVTLPVHHRPTAPSLASISSRRSSVDVGQRVRAVQGPSSVGSRAQTPVPNADEAEEDFDKIGRSIFGFQRKMTEQASQLKVLQSEIAAKSAELVKVREGAEKLKKFSKEQIARALQKSAEAQTAMERTIDELRDSAKRVLASDEDLSIWNDLRRSLTEELQTLDLPIGDQLEKIEETKIKVLKELNENLSQREEVIQLLRGKLESQAGELAEARARVAELESNHSKSIDGCTTQLRSIELLMAGVQGEQARLLSKGKEQVEAMEGLFFSGEERIGLEEAEKRRMAAEAELKAVIASASKAEEKFAGAEKERTNLIDDLAKLQATHTSTLSRLKELEGQLAAAQASLKQSTATQKESDAFLQQSSASLALMEKEKLKAVHDCEKEVKRREVAEDLLKRKEAELAKVDKVAKEIKATRDSLSSKVEGMEALLKQQGDALSKEASSRTAAVDLDEAKKQAREEARRKYEEAEIASGASMKDLQEQVSSLRASLKAKEESESSLVALRNELGAKLSEQSSLIRASSDTTKASESERKEVQRLERAVEAAEKKTADAQRALAEERDKNEQDRAQLAAADGEAQTYRAQIASLQSEVSGLKAEKATFGQQTDKKVKEAYQQTVAAFDKKKAEHNNEMKRLKNRIEQDEKKLALAAEEIARLKKAAEPEPAPSQDTPETLVGENGAAMRVDVVVSKEKEKKTTVQQPATDPTDNDTPEKQKQKQATASLSSIGVDLDSSDIESVVTPPVKVVVRTQRKPSSTAAPAAATLTAAQPPKQGTSNESKKRAKAPVAESSKSKKAKVALETEADPIEDVEEIQAETKKTRHARTTYGSRRRG